MKKQEKESNYKKAPILWMHEAIAYLGLDKLGLSRPKKVMYRLFRKE